MSIISKSVFSRLLEIIDMPQGRFSPLIFPGAKLGSLTVIKRIPGNRQLGQRAGVLCVCDCGETIKVEASNLSSGNSTSCGCKKYQGLEQYRETQREEGYKEFVPGRIFGRLTVLKKYNEEGRVRLLCRCDCGNLHDTTADGVRRGYTNSCGCLKREETIKRNKETSKFQGYTKKFPKIHQTWATMKARCYNKKTKSYNNYGKKGVFVCDYLLESPENLANIIGHPSSLDLTLDRYPIHNGNYTCGQCEQCLKSDWKKNIRWATRKQQAENRGNFNVFIEAFGRKLLKSQWMALSGLGWKCLTGRIRRGWDIEQALTTPDTKGNCLKVSDLQ